jgi:hypothetical protein
VFVVSITITVDGDELTLDSRQESVREILRMASEESGRAKWDRVLVLHPAEGGEPIEYYSMTLRVLLRHGMRFTTRRH